MMNNKTKIISIELILILCCVTFSPSLAWSQDTVTISVGNGSGIPGSFDNPVDVSLTNLNNMVKGVTVDICDVNNYLTCTVCETTDRTPDFWCSTNELASGCVRVILVSFSGSVIEEGNGPIFTLRYDVSEEEPPDTCIALTPENENVSDELGNPLSVILSSGQFCFFVCGDVYPPECPPGPGCGDGVVGIYDILEEIDFILDVVEPSDCQSIRADVPNGTPPECIDPNSVIDIFDLIVIIDVALDKDNCCEY